MSSADQGGGALETSALLRRLPGVSAYRAQVVEAGPLTPVMRRVRLAAEGLGALDYTPGQDLMVAVPGDGGGHFRRRYTIRRLDRGAEVVDLDIVVPAGEEHPGPGARWASRARPGDEVEALGPRGQVRVVPEADWHLFAGDESAIPAMAAMAESLGAGQRALIVLEVPGPDDEQPIELAAGVQGDVRWIERPGPPGTGTGLAEALGGIELPPGTGHAYLAGELQVVAGMRRALLARGLSAEQLSPKPYWRRGRANAAHGEPEREG